jgi:hypothetical protein
MLRDAGLLFSSDDFQLGGDKVVSISVSDRTKQHVSVSVAFALSNFIPFNLRPAPKIEAAIDIMATHLADIYAVRATFTIGDSLTLLPTQSMQ